MIILETKRLILRQFELADTEEIFLFSREKALLKWIPDQVYADPAEARETLEFLMAQYEPARLPYVLAVATREGVLIGHVGLSVIKQGVEIGFAIGERYQNRGYAAEAAGAYAEWGKRRFGLTEIYGIVDVYNAASCRTLEKAGFVYLKADAGGEFGIPAQRKIYIK